MKIQLTERKNKEWDYRFVASNGNILVVSEGYESKSNAKRAASNFLDSVYDYIRNENTLYEEVDSGGITKVITESI